MLIRKIENNRGRMEEINEIREEMNNVGIKHLTETEIEYNTI